MSESATSALIRRFLRYLIAVVAIGLAFLWRRWMNTYFGAELPEYITFYPVVMIVAILDGLGPGLMATAVAALLAVFWILPPYGHFIGLALFGSMGAFISVFAELYRRARRKAAAYDEEVALRGTQEALRDSEARFRSMYEHAAVGIEQVATDGRLLMVNPALCRTLGYGESELLNRTFEDIIHPDDRDRDAVLLKELLRAERDSYEIEKRYLHRDGTPVWVNVTSSLVRDGAGQPLYRISIIQDITGRKRAVEALRRAVAFDEAAMKSLGEGLYTIDENGLVTTMNPAAEELFGWTFAELRGKKMHDMTHHHYRDGRPFPSAECAGFQVLTQGTPLKSHEDVFIHKDGHFFDVIYSVAPLRDVSGKITGLVVVFNDITERKRAEEALRSGEERLAAVIDNAMDAIITVDESQRVVLFNAAAEKTFGCSASEVIGKPLDRFLPDRFRPAHTDHIQTFGLTGTAARSMHFLKTLYGRRANGEEFPLEATISQASIGGQKLYTIILRDISPRKQAEELARLYAQSQELDQLKTEFFANISHELRTPLALIVGPIRKMRAAGRMGEAEKRDLELVERNTGLLLRRVNDLLDLSKLDAGGMKADYAAIDLAGLGKLVASSFDSLANERGIRYLIDIPSSLPAQLDPGKIERVLLNLLSNAFRFTPAGGTVRLTIRQENNRAVVEVEDTGPGIPPQLREGIFERFRHIEGGSYRHFGGTGLGLSIARQFVSLHDGRITVGEARNQAGALLRVELPLLAPPGTEVLPAGEYDPEASRQAVEEFAVRNVARSRSGAARGSSAPLVLIVEDNPDMNAFLSDRLAASYRTVSAFDGREGLNKALELRPDLILCDIMMPVMTGDQLVREVRKHQELDHVPIVLLTAKADDELLVQLLKEGAQDYLQKPFAADRLLAKMDRLIADRRHMAVELERMHQLSGHLLQAEDHERKQIAHELHENTAQYLAALGMNLSLARDSDVAMSPKVQRILADGLSLLELCMSDIRTMSYALHPFLLDHFGLEPAMDWHVKSFSQRSGIEVSLDISPGFGRLPAELELVLFRIMQEALTNVRHSGKKKAAVRVFRNELEVGLDVADEGEMLPKQTPEAGAPEPEVEAILERARSLGGRVEITTRSDGTTLRAVLPLMRPQSELTSGPS
ncbi:MAG TPA: PAS domain S-box protein [Terriglobales bacterium]|nr:PAS domain S-box protein [Terriglobales bacterium]